MVVQHPVLARLPGQRQAREQRRLHPHVQPVVGLRAVSGLRIGRAGGGGIDPRLRGVGGPLVAECQVERVHRRRGDQVAEMRGVVPLQVGAVAVIPRIVGRLVRVGRVQRLIIAAIVLQVTKIELRLQHAASEQRADTDAPEQGRVVTGGVRVVEGRKALRVEAEHRPACPHQQRQPGSRHRRVAEIERADLVGKGIGHAGVDALALRRGVVAAQLIELQHGRVVELAGDAREHLAVAHLRGIAGGHVGGKMRPRLRAAPGDDVDDSADGAGAVQRGHRAANDLDPLHVGQRVHAEIECAPGVGGVVDRHAVAQHQHLVGVGAAHEHAGVAAGTARLGDAQTGNVFQRLGQREIGVVLDLLARDHADAGGDVGERRGHAGGGDHDVGLRDARHRNFLGIGGKSSGDQQGRERQAHGGPSWARGAARGARLRLRDDSRLRVSLPLPRFTPPVARAQSRRRPVSWLAGHRRAPPSRPVGDDAGQWHDGAKLAATVAGAAAPGHPASDGPSRSRFSPCGPPASARTLPAEDRKAMIPRVEFD